MSEAPRRLPPPSNPALAPTLLAIAYLAAVIALWGVLSLALDRDVIDYRDAGPLLGPAVAVVASAVVWVVLWRSRAAGSPWPAALAALLGSLVAMLLAAGVGYSVTRGDLGWMLRAPAHLAIGPFVPGAALLAGLVVLSVRLIAPRKNGR